MNTLWNALAKLDSGRYSAKKKLDSLLGRDDYRARMEESVKDVFLPQKVIQFDD